MVSTFTPNIQLEEPARGDDVGTWDTPVNSNMTLIDSVVGGIATISLNNSPVVLSAAQYKSRQITFNSTLTGNCAITFPTSFTKSYEIQNLCTGSSAFVITLATTASGGQQIACPFGETIDCFNDGTNIKFKNLGRVGAYWDYGGSSVPSWVSNCTVPPYLNCDASKFSATTYPTLAAILGSTTLPDSRGRARIALDAGVGRVSSAISQIAGNTIFSGGGDQNMQTHTHGVTDNGHNHNILSNGHAITGLDVATAGSNTLSGGLFAQVSVSAVQTSVTGVLINNQGLGNSQNMPPVLVHGITMIRAA